MKFLYKKGDTYILHQQSPVPWLHSNDGEFAGMRLDGRDCKGKEYMDYAAKVARRAFLEITASQTMALCGTCGAEKNPRWQAGL